MGEVPTPGLDRRALLRRAAAAGGIVVAAPIISTFHLPAGAQAVSGDGDPGPGPGGLAAPVITSVCQLFDQPLYRVFGTAPPNVLILIFNNSSCSGEVQNSLITDDTGTWGDQFTGPNGDTFTAQYQTLTDPALLSPCSNAMSSSGQCP